MNEALLHRMAVLTGLVLAAAIAAWWLGSTRLALDHARDAADSSANALLALFLVRGMVLAVVGVRVGALRGWRPAVTTGVGLIGPSWPLVLLAWCASTLPFARVVLGEALLLAGSVALPLIGVGLRSWLRQAEFAVMTATTAGLSLAAAVWLTRAFWIPTLS